MNSFTWLNDIFQGLLKFIPRVILVRTTYQGILFTRKGKVVVKKPGLFIYWPLVSQIRLIPTTIRSFKIQPIVIDEIVGPYGFPLAICCGAIIQVRVYDPVKMVSVYDFSSYVESTVAASLSDKNINLEEVFKKHGIEIKLFTKLDKFKRISLGLPQNHYRLEHQMHDNDNLKEETK